MAPRATGFAKKTPPPATEAARVDVRTLLPESEYLEQPDPVPLDLAPLVAPYRRRGRVTVRVERLPHRARLSRGQNNGDRSWSLALDELEGLLYLPANSADEIQTLSIRIVRVEAGDAATLALLDCPLAPGGAASEPANSRKTVAPSTNKELSNLREELARAQATLEVREFELADARRVALDRQRQNVDAQLAAVRADWEAEVEERLALASKLAASELEKNRAQWRSDEEARRARADNRVREIARQEMVEALAKAETEWKAQEAARFAAAEEKWRQQSAKALADATAEFEKSKSKASAQTAPAKTDDAELRRLREIARREMVEALANAETEWKAQESARLAAAEARWQQQSAKALADATAEFEKSKSKALAQTVPAKTDDGELRRMRDELAKAKISLSERDGELARARSEAELLRADRIRLGKLNDELSSSKSTLVDREIEWARARAEMDALRSELEKMRTALAAREGELRQSRTEAEALREGGDELKRMSAELAGAKASLAVRDAELERTRVLQEQAKIRWQQEADASLVEAQERWRAGEAERFAAEEAKWREHSEMAISEVVARLDRAEARTLAEIEHNRDSNGQVHRLSGDLTKLKAALADRDSELASARLAHEQARERWTEEAEAALAKAQESWKAREAEKVAEAQAQSEAQSTLAIAEMAAQIKQLEELLTQAREHNKKLRSRGDSDDFRQLRKEFASLQATLAQRESELSQLRTNHELDRERWTSEARFAVRQADHVWQAEDAEEAERKHRAQTARKLLRDALLVTTFLGLAMFGYYRVAPILTNSPPEFLQNILDQAGIASVQPQIAPQTKKPVAALPAKAVAVLPSLVVVHGANLRAGPSSTAAAIGLLPRDTKVIGLENHGSWTHVRYAGAGGKSLEGWVFTSFLKDTAQKSDQKPAAGTP